MTIRRLSAIRYAIISGVVVALQIALAHMGPRWIFSLAFVLKLITPSAGERAIWAPIAFLLLISSTGVAFTNSSAPPKP
jgi:hypothetical protein